MESSTTSATHATVHDLATALTLDEAAYTRAVELAQLRPDRADWLRYLDSFLAAVGALIEQLESVQPWSGSAPGLRTCS